MSKKSKTIEIPLEESQVPSTPETEEGGMQSSSPSDVPRQKSSMEELEENANKLMDDPSYDPMTAPAALFGLYGVHLFRFVDAMSNKQLKRLIKVLVTYPLEDIKVNKKNEIEVQAFQIADKMLQSKYLMQMVVWQEEENKRKNQVADVSLTEVKDEPSKPE